jgi:transcriptional regulator PpsR
MSSPVEQRSSARSADHFRVPAKWLAELSEAQAGALIAAAADVTLVLDDAGIITDLAFGSDELSHEGYAAWLGQPWVDTVTRESRGKIEAMLRDADVTRSPRWRQINHPTEGGEPVPVQYATLKLGHDGPVVALGRDLRSVAALQRRLVEAQQTMEREYSRLRSAETRYRLLFQVANEAVAILDADSGRVIEVNPAAGKLLGRSARDLVGQDLAAVFDSNGRMALQGLVAQVAKTGHGDDFVAQAAGAGKPLLTVAVTMFRQEKVSYLLVRLSPAEEKRGGAKPGRMASTLLTLVEEAPDGFVVTDPNGDIIMANAAFLELVQIPLQEQLRGESLGRWLGRPGVDLNVLLSALREHGSVRLFSTSLHGEFGSAIEVEISAVAAASSEQPCMGFTLRNVSPRLAPEAATPLDLPRSVEQLTALVGRVPLKDLVRESTDMIESLCIEAALQLTKDNRASAAEMLGLSRQSLYVKLRRYGLGDLSGDADSKS